MVADKERKLCREPLVETGNEMHVSAASTIGLPLAMSRRAQGSKKGCWSYLYSIVFLRVRLALGGRVRDLFGGKAHLRAFGREVAQASAEWPPSKVS